MPPLTHIITLPAFCIYAPGIDAAMFFLYLLGPLLRLLTSRGGILAQTPLCFPLSLQADPQRTRCERELLIASAGRAQARLLQEVLLQQEKDLCVV